MKLGLLPQFKLVVEHRPMTGHQTMSINTYLDQGDNDAEPQMYVCTYIRIYVWNEPQIYYTYRSFILPRGFGGFFTGLRGVYFQPGP